MTLPAERAREIRAHIQKQAAEKSVEDLIALVSDRAGQVAAVARTFEPGDFAAPRGEGWSPRECLAHLVEWDLRNAQQILYAALSGELPPESEVELPADAAGLLAKHDEGLESLYVHVREADPDAYLDFTWDHMWFGPLNWREWLFFLRVHMADHLGQLQAMQRA